MHIAIRCSSGYLYIELSSLEYPFLSNFPYHFILKAFKQIIISIFHPS
jgi:hypothetical protein